jgi:hypothetical protein
MHVYMHAHTYTTTTNMYHVKQIAFEFVRRGFEKEVYDGDSPCHFRILTFYSFEVVHVRV